MQSGATLTNNVSAADGGKRFNAAKVEGKTMPARIYSEIDNDPDSSTTERGDNAARISTPVPPRCGPRMRYATCAVSTSNGMDFLSFHRMNVCCSSAFFDGRSAVKNAIRAVSSGTTTAISDPLNPTCDRSCWTIGRAASGLPPAGNSVPNFSAILLRCEFTAATMTCLDVNSHAHNGACGLKNSVMVSTTLLLNECDLVDFLQSSDASKDFRESVITKKRHAFFVR